MKLIKKSENEFVLIDKNGQQVDFQLDIKHIKNLLGEVDVEKKAEEWFLINQYNQQDMIHSHRIPEYITTKNLWVTGYNQAIQDNKDNIDKILDFLILKMESISQDMINKDSLHLGRFRAYKQIYETIKPKTEWDIEFDSQGKLKLK